MKPLGILIAILLGISWAALAQSQASPQESPPFPMTIPGDPVFPDRTVDIRDCGAVGDGLTLNTQAFARAINGCAEAGGGKVLVPPGIWLTGAIHLRSHVNLHIQEGAEIRFSTDPDDYLPPVFVRWAGFECYNYSPLIYARDCQNIAITGDGCLNGQGPYWWDWAELQDRVAGELYALVLKETPVENRVFGNPEEPLRPQFIQPIDCDNVLIEGISILAGPFWTVHAVYCEDFIARGVKVITDGPNNDGINLDSCKNALVEDCFLWTGDDCVAIKSGLNEDGWRVGRPCENVIVRHCRMERGHGGVVIGSEMSGGVRNIYVHDCEFSGTEIGIRLKSTRGRGGVVENVWCRNLRMGHIEQDAIRIRTDYKAWFGSETGAPPFFRNINMERISCDRAKSAVRILGLPERFIEGVTLKNLSIRSEEGVSVRNAEGIRLEDSSIRPQSGPVVQLESVTDAEIRRFIPSGAEETLLEVLGDKCGGIQIEECDLSTFARPIVGGEGTVSVKNRSE
ncbi:MAG: glycoside hydrolase family 28 protein [Candidatus Omnitrophica bacterium]|nr:glycoside hydrolase family 28 protein [Candidatus Omnitrophota bacterium]